MNKILMLLFVLLLVPTISSADFDNVVEWSEDNKTATIINAFGFGDVIANITILSNYGENKMNYVEVGEDVTVLQFYVENFGDNYSNGFTRFRFNNLRTREENEDWKTFTWVYPMYENVTVNDWELVCEDVWNEENQTIQEECTEQIIGSHEETVIEDWRSFQDFDIPTGNWMVGIQTDVEVGDYYDGVPTFFGVEMERWAAWQSIFKDAHGNGFDNAAGDTSESWGEYVKVINGTTRIISFNISADSTADTCGAWDTSTKEFHMGTLTGNNCSFSPFPVFENATEVYLFTNHTSGTFTHDQCDSCFNHNNDVFTNLDWIKASNNFGATNWTTTVGAEIEAVWSQTLVVLVTLNSPPNNHETAQTFVNFNCTATNEVGDINNLSLIIDGVVNITNTTAATSVNLNATVSNLSVGTHTWNCNATADDNEIVTTTRRNFIVGLNTTGESFNANVTETSNEKFNVNITIPSSIISVSATLNYSGNLNQGTVTCTGTDCVIERTLDIPLISLESELINFNWVIEVFDGSQSLNLIRGTQQQNVSRIHLEQCNATWVTPTLNFTVFDEQNLSSIDPFDFDGTFEFWTGLGSIRRNNSFSGNFSSFGLCLSPNVTMTTEAIIDYDEGLNTSTYTNRFFYFDQALINNITQDISMYLLKSVDSTSFILKVQDENLLPVADALIEVHRYYPGTNEFKIVQIAKTDDSGKSVGFFETETVDYKFIIKKGGVTLLETGQQKIIPESSPFTLTFNTGTDLGAPWSSQEQVVNLETTLSFNSSNNVVTYTYIDSSLNFTQGRLLVQQTSLINSTAYTIICNETSVLSTATITCNLSSFSSGFFIAGGYITRTGEGLVKQITFQIEDFSSTVGLLGLFLGFFLIVIASFMFKFNEIAGIWAITVTVFLVNIIGLIKFGGIFITAIIGLAIILTWILER